MKKKFEKVTPELIKECTDDLEFYDKHGYFSWENKFKIWVKKHWEEVVLVFCIFGAIYFILKAQDIFN